jgi:NADH dehydrogenase
MNDKNGPKHVVMVGGGFAGIGCARKLASKKEVRVTLIDKNNYHQFQPLLYQVATSILAPDDVAVSLRKLFRKSSNVDVKLAEVVAVDPTAKTVTTNSGEVYQGDYLVLVAGSQPNFFRTPGAEEYSFPLYSLNDAERLRVSPIGRSTTTIRASWPWSAKARPSLRSASIAMNSTVRWLSPPGSACMPT